MRDIREMTLNYIRKKQVEKNNNLNSILEWMCQHKVQLSLYPRVYISTKLRRNLRIYVCFECEKR